MVKLSAPIDKKWWLVPVVLVSLLATGAYYFLETGFIYQVFYPIKHKATIEDHVFSDRAVVFSVSGPAGTFPVFEKELVVDPFTEVKTGDKQYFSVWVKDDEGIEKVSAKTKTDSEVFQFDLYLVEGDNKEGRWLGGWEVKDISPQKDYITDLTAYSKTGEITTVGNSWKSAER